jgi:hypothetical protein
MRENILWKSHGVPPKNIRTVELVLDHLGETVSEPFASRDRRRIAVKVIDERGNELRRAVEIGVKAGWRELPRLTNEDARLSIFKRNRA